MKALLLAAGRGRRLLPRTAAVPKPMAVVEGSPILVSNVQWLKEHGVTEIAVNLHHLPNVITEHFSRDPVSGVQLTWSHEPELLGTAEALCPLRGFFGSERFLVVYGDNLVRCDLDSLVQLHERTRAEISVALWWREDTSSSGVAELAGEKITRFLEKPRRGESDSRWVNAGVLLCEPSVLAAVNTLPMDFGRDLLPLLVARGTVAGYRMGAGESLAWIDNPADACRVGAVFESAPGQ